MKSVMGLLIMSAIVFVTVSTCFAEIELESGIADEEATTILISENNEFALDLYREVCSSVDNENIFFSPYSISTALGMTYFGAREETASEMASVLHFSLSPKMINRAFHLITEKLSTRTLGPTQPELGNPFTLTISNGIWVQKDFDLLFSYKSVIKEFFDASADNLNFSEDPEQARETINSWVADNTMQKILNLIPQGLISSETRLVLTNAIYFKASWQHPFDQHLTTERDFSLTDGSRIIVPMMNQVEYFNYASTDEWSAVSLEYVGGETRMLIILPEGELREFEESFSYRILETIKENLSSVNVSLSLPRFEFTQSMILSDILKELGMETAFSQNANFSGITGMPNLSISEVIHKAFIKVDEEGTEAAAATAVVMKLLCMPTTPIEMNLNRPFIFLIEDNTTGSIVFMGRVMNPTI